MEIEKLIERLKYYGTTYAIGDNLGKEIDGSDELILNAATALSTLQAKNEKLRADLEYEREHANAYHEECGQWEAENENLRAELDRLRSEPGQELWSAENQRADRLAAELERVRKDNKRLCAAMMAVRRKESPEPMRVVYELGYDAILSHEDIQDIARIVFDGLMREDLKRRGQKEDI